MTVSLAWVGQRRDGRRHLYMASDSRVTGGHRLDACPKILLLPRSDCALCFAGDTEATYPLMIQLSYAIAAHQPARERSLDITRVKEHLLRVFTDLFLRIEEPAHPFEVEFLFGGYSWLHKDFCLWNIYYGRVERRFFARPSRSFHPRLPKAAFIGDWARPVRSKVVRKLNQLDDHAYLEPLHVLAGFLEAAQPADSIGGAPQVVRVTEHMNTRPLCVRWGDDDMLFGRPLFDYENTDYWTVDPFTGTFAKPRKFGLRETPGAIEGPPLEE